MFITLINISLNEIIYDRHCISDNKLYFVENGLQTMMNFGIKCVSGHKLTQRKTNISSSIGNTTNRVQRCDNCDKRIETLKENNQVYFYCFECGETICQMCCEAKIGIQLNSKLDYIENKTHTHNYT